MYARVAKTYSEVDLGSMPKTQVVERLYERFGRDIDAARAAIAARDIPAKAAALDHATQIATQLRLALDPSAAPELCANLSALYQFVIDKLFEANLKLTTPPLDAAARVMNDLGAAFRAAHAGETSVPAAPPPAVAPAPAPSSSSKPARPPTRAAAPATPKSTR